MAERDASIGQIGSDIEVRLQHLQEKHPEVLSELATQLNVWAQSERADPIAAVQA